MSKRQHPTSITRGRTPTRGRPQRSTWARLRSFIVSQPLPIAVALLFLAVFASLVVLLQREQSNAQPVLGQPVANIKCDQGEQTAVHYHAHLAILYHGTPVPIPALVGIPNQGQCLYWLHTHDTTGVIHVEAPSSASKRTFTLGEFFQVWRQPLNSKRVASLDVGKGEQLKIWVDGKPYRGDPNQVALKSHAQIVLQIGPDFQDPPPTYTWGADLPR